jgi:hypothetical protein
MLVVTFSHEGAIGVWDIQPHDLLVRDFGDEHPDTYGASSESSFTEASYRMSTASPDAGCNCSVRSAFFRSMF